VSIPPPPSPGAITPEIRIIRPSPKEHSEIEAIRPSATDSRDLRADLAPTILDFRVNQARSSRINTSEMSYYVAPRPLSQRRMDIERPRSPKAGDKARGSQFTFLQRRSMPSDVNVDRERGYPRQHSPTRFRGLRLQPPNQSK